MSSAARAWFLVVVELLGVLAVDGVLRPPTGVSTVWGSASQTRVAFDIGVRTSLAPSQHRHRPVVTRLSVREPAGSRAAATTASFAAIAPAGLNAGLSVSRASAGRAGADGSDRHGDVGGAQRV